jgi:DNA-binding beta-propeller fold protein YncE
MLSHDRSNFVYRGTPMTLAAWFSSLRQQRRLTRTGARRNRSRAFNRRASFEALEDRRLLSTVSFASDTQTADQGATDFSVTVALSGSVTTLGSDWPGPVGLAVDSNGILYVNQSDDAGTVSKVLPGGQVTEFVSGFTPLHAMAGDLAFGLNGNLYVANTGANEVDEVTPSGHKSKFVSLNDPVGLAFDFAGNLYVSDFKDNKVSKVAPSGNVESFASAGLDGPTGLACDRAGNVYVANKLGHTVSEYFPTGQVASVLTAFTAPDAVAIDPVTNRLYVADAGINTVFEILGAGNYNDVIPGLADPDGMVFDSAGDLYIAEYGDSETIGTVNEYSAPATVPFTIGGTAVSNVAYSGVTASPLTFDIAQTTQTITGTLLADPGPSQTMIFGLGNPSGTTVVSPSVCTLTIMEPPTVQFSALGETVNASTGTISIPVTVSGASNSILTVPFTLSGSAASGTDFSSVTASPLTFQSGQTTEDITVTFLSDPGPSQTLTVSLGTPMGGGLGSPSDNTLTIAEPVRVQFVAAGEAVSESAGSFIIPVTVAGTLTGTPFASGTSFNTPSALAADAAGNVYVANAGDGTVSEVSPTGQVSLFASGFKLPMGLAFHAGKLYVADQGADTVYEVPAANATPITVESGFNNPTGLAFDSKGNLYVAELDAGTVREVQAAGGPPGTFASGLNSPIALAFDAAGNLYVANLVDGTVSKVAKAGGTASTFASGFNNPIGLAFDSAGNLYVADSENNTVDEVTATRAVSIFADGFQLPAGLAIVAGGMYVTDTGNDTMSQVTGFAVPFAIGGSAAAGVAYTGVTAGVLTFGIGQTTQFITGTLLSDPGPARALTFTLGTPTGGAVLGSPSVNTLTISEPAQGSTGSSLPPVFLGEERVFSGKGKHKKLVGFEFLFNGALNAGSAQSTRNYHVTQKLGKKVKVLVVRSALYDPGNFSVTISVAGFNTGKAAKVTVAGLEGANGAAIAQISSGL